MALGTGSRRVVACQSTVHPGVLAGRDDRNLGFEGVLLGGAEVRAAPAYPAAADGSTTIKTAPDTQPQGGNGVGGAPWGSVFGRARPSSSNRVAPEPLRLSTVDDDNDERPQPLQPERASSGSHSGRGGGTDSPLPQPAEFLASASLGAAGLGKSSSGAALLGRRAASGGGAAVPAMSGPSSSSLRAPLSTNARSSAELRAPAGGDEGGRGP